jgi:hypothetical protein
MLPDNYTAPNLAIVPIPLLRDTLALADLTPFTSPPPPPAPSPTPKLVIS